ncbi:protease modulator HflC [Aestuariispira insulae]|uniref:Protein HflC n=1 Tax=Aestuariispira insulae TaxID=1461337 RepID=A0A3D9HXH8_9PROT|nr:protease modulator HflC [Aestuariispira insulae]RED54208.1 membrane protease subunit HflC [Aestuariispira insulae]
MFKSSTFLLIGTIAVAAVAYSSMFTVRETEQALVFELGKPVEKKVETGLNFKIPFIQEVRYFDKRVLDYDASAKEIPTADQKQVVVDAFTRYRINNPLGFYTAVNNEISLQQRLDAIIDNSLRDVLGDVQLADVLTPKRAQMMRDFTQLVESQATGFGVEVVDVRIKRIDLPEANSQAIYRRMSTEREKEARLFRAEGEKASRRIKADADKQKRIIEAEAAKKAEILRGEGDAQAQAIYNDAYGQDAEFFDFWRSMQALEKGLSSEKTTYVGPPSGEFFRYFSTDGGVKQ